MSIAAINALQVIALVGVYALYRHVKISQLRKPPVWLAGWRAALNMKKIVKKLRLSSPGSVWKWKSWLKLMRSSAKPAIFRNGTDPKPTHTTH